MEPLPYIVRLRVAADDDSIPETREHKVIAYSVSEAVMQACYRSGRDIGAVAVEDIQADYDAFYKMKAERKATGKE